MILQFGNIVNPIGILDKSGKSRTFDSPTGGIVVLGSGILRLLVIGAGVYALFNFVIAGISYITSDGDPQKVSAAQNKIFISIIGLIIIAASFIISAVIGLLFFKDPLIFISPSIYKP